MSRTISLLLPGALALAAVATPIAAQTGPADGSTVDLPCTVAPDRYLPAPLAFEVTITNTADHPLMRGTRITYSYPTTDPAHPSAAKTFRLASLLPPNDRIHDELPAVTEGGACHAWYVKRKRPDPDS